MKRFRDFNWRTDKPKGTIPPVGYEGKIVPIQPVGNFKVVHRYTKIFHQDRKNKENENVAVLKFGKLKSLNNSKVGVR